MLGWFIDWLVDRLGWLLAWVGLGCVARLGWCGSGWVGLCGSGWLDGWLVGRLADLVDWFGWLVAWLGWVGLPGWVGSVWGGLGWVWLDGWLVGGFGWLVGWIVGRLGGWVGWLVGWLAGWLFWLVACCLNVAANGPVRAMRHKKVLTRTRPCLSQTGAGSGKTFFGTILGQCKILEARGGLRARPQNCMFRLLVL